MMKQRAKLLKNLAETQKIIVDLETSYLDKQSNLGIILRGWPETENLVANDNGNVVVQKLFSAGNRDSISGAGGKNMTYKISDNR